MNGCWNRCDVCGKFVPLSDLESGRALRHLISVDSEYSSEEFETLCKRHNMFDKRWTHAITSFKQSPEFREIVSPGRVEPKQMNRGGQPPAGGDPKPKTNRSGRRIDGPTVVAPKGADSQRRRLTAQPAAKNGTKPRKVTRRGKHSVPNPPPA